jgi:hypothetical protein
MKKFIFITLVLLLTSCGFQFEHVHYANPYHYNLYPSYYWYRPAYPIYRPAYPIVHYYSGVHYSSGYGGVHHGGRR